MIPYGRQTISDEDIRAVVATLKSPFLTQGPEVPLFETAVCEKVGAGYGVAVNSATSALHLACLALGLGPGDLAWTVPISFVASANCARLCGADVDFVDIDPASFNLCPTALAAKLETAVRAGRLPKVLIPVHMGGLSPAMERIAALAQAHGVRIVEDASHAIGAHYASGFVGGGAFSDITVFSFHPVKIITAGEGGMALTNDPALAAAMTDLRSHGITRDTARFVQDADGPWSYQQLALGLNYRMTDLQAALGRSQLTRLDDIVDRRRKLAQIYDDALVDLPLTCQHHAADACSAHHLYIVRLDDPALRRPVFERLREAGIGVNVHYAPIHLQPYYRDLGFGDGDFPSAENYYAGVVTLPLFPELKTNEQARVIRALTTAIDELGGLT